MNQKNVLDGIRVLDFGKFIAGPFCAALLADYGADVIRVDRLGGSDDRFVSPVTEQGDGAFFLQVNRNKRSIALDINSEDGRKVINKLLEDTDVVIANMPPTILKKLGLDYDSIRKIKPDIILTASSAFGLHPSLINRVGFDGIGQAVSGSVYMAGSPEQPMKSMVPVVDFGTAMSCAFGTIMALYERQQSGMGQEVNASLLQTALNFSSGSLIEEAVLDVGRKATLNRAPTFGPSDIFKTRNGWIILQVIGRPMFKRWAELIGQPQLVDDPRFVKDEDRGEHGEILSELMSDWCKNRDQGEVLALLEQARIPASPVNSPRQVLESEEVKKSDALQWFDYPGAKKQVPVIRPPVSLSRTGPRMERRPPTAGEHTEEILMELGFTDDAIKEFRSQGVI